MTILSWSISILVSAVTAAAELRQGLLLNKTVLQGRKVKYLHRFCLSAVHRAPTQVTLPCPLSPAHASGQIQWQQAGFGLGFDPALPEYPRYRYDRSYDLLMICRRVPLSTSVEVRQGLGRLPPGDREGNAV